MLPPCHDKYIEKHLHQLRKEIRTLGLFQVSFCLVHLVWLLSVFLVAACLLEIIEFLRLEKASKVIQNHWENQTLFRELSVEEQTYSTHVLTTGGTLWTLTLGRVYLVLGALESWGFLSLFWLDISCTYYGRTDSPVLQIFQKSLFRSRLYFWLLV